MHREGLPLVRGSASFIKRSAYWRACLLLLARRRTWRRRVDLGLADQVGAGKGEFGRKRRQELRLRESRSGSGHQERTGSNAAALDALHDVVAALERRAVDGRLVTRAASAALEARQCVEAERAALLPAPTARRAGVAPPARDGGGSVDRRAGRRCWALDRGRRSSDTGTELRGDVEDACKRRRISSALAPQNQGHGRRLTLAIVGVDRAVGANDARGKVADVGGGEVGHKDAVVLREEALWSGSRTRPTGGLAGGKTDDKGRAITRTAIQSLDRRAVSRLG